MTHAEVNTMLKKENEKVSASSVSLELKPPYLTEVDVKPYPSRYKLPKF